MRAATANRAYPWALIVAFVALSAWANSLHAPDAGVLRLMAGLVPVSAALCWHLLVRPGLAGGWRRAVSRLVALAVFAVSIAASFETLTAVGERAGLPLPWALPVALDGLATVAALSVWSARSGEFGASSVVPSPDLSAARVDSVRPGQGAYAARPDILPTQPAKLPTQPANAPANGHGRTAMDRAVAAALALEDGGQLPSRAALARAAKVSGGTAGAALARLRTERQSAGPS